MLFSTLPYIYILITEALCLKPLGSVQCAVDYRVSEDFISAVDKCEETVRKENKHMEEKPFPRNATLEELDYDDHCVMGCAFEALGLMSSEGTLVDKSQTPSVFSQGKISKEKCIKVSVIWDKCLEESAKVVKVKALDKCGAALLQAFCFFKRMRDSYDDMRIEC